MKAYTFPHGGILFQDPFAPVGEHSVLSFLPQLAVFPLNQHTGNALNPCVNVGDQVREGQLIAVGAMPGEANIHTSIPGKVVSIVTLEKAYPAPTKAIVVALEGEFDLLGKKETTYAWETLSPFELRHLISEFGIVEMSSTGRPVSDILSTFHSGDGNVTLVLTCVFDDPWLAGERALCIERSEAVAEGAAIIMRATKAQRVIVAVSQKDKHIADLLE